MSIQQICPVSGECVAFGRGEDVFQSWFSDIRKAGITSIRPIGGISVNGFVRELKRSVGGYDSYVVLKSNLDPNSDNLYYEWWVGDYLNTFMNRFPLFVKTYGVYEYAPGDKQLMQDHPESALPVIDRLRNTTIRRSIEASENICIVLQHVHNAIPLRALIDSYKVDPMWRHEILCVLYQVYFVLPLITGFSHNDLHDENVILIPAKDKYYEYTYTKEGRAFTFQCMYAAKIIDCGRCVFPATTWLKNKLDTFSTEVQQTNEGYPWNTAGMEQCNAVDFRILKKCIDLSILPDNFFNIMKKTKPLTNFTTCDALVYGYLGRKMNKEFRQGLPDMYDVATQLEKLIQPRTYALPRACTIHVSDVELMRVDWPVSYAQAAGTRRKRKTKRSRSRSTRSTRSTMLTRIR